MVRTVYELSQFRIVELLGVRIIALDMQELLDICEKYIQQKNSLLLGVVNVAKIVNARKYANLKKSLNETDLILADGLPIVWLSKMIGNPLPERVAGIDIMYKLLECSSQKNYGVYFLGAKPEVVKKVVEFAEVSYPGLRIAGFRDGYFNESNEQSVAEEIGESNADILFVAMTSPKKENFLRKWHNVINVSVCHGVGGSFDIVAGVTKRAPNWMQKCGLEWLYRVIQEPQRMWKRYLITNTIFVFLSIREILHTRFNRLFSRFN